MAPQQKSRREREERANRLVMAGFGGLMALVMVVLAFASLRPPVASKAPEAEQNAVAETPAPALAPTRTIAPAPAAAPAPKPPKPAAPKPTPAPPVAPKPAPRPAKKTLPEQMDRLPSGTKQLIVITGKQIGSKSGQLALWEKGGSGWTKVMDVTANFGDNGLIDGEKRRQGNLETPTGIWSIGGFLFGLHSSAPSGTKMPYRPIKNSSYWSSERDSTYNTWVDHRVSGEHLIDADPQYEYAFNTGYNSPPNKRVIGRGTAIFIHCFEPPGNSLGKYTHGCIAIAPDNMIALFKKLDPDKKPACAIGTLQKGSSTSIWAY